MLRVLGIEQRADHRCPLPLLAWQERDWPFTKGSYCTRLPIPIPALAEELSGRIGKAGLEQLFPPKPRRTVGVSQGVCWRAGEEKRTVLGSSGLREQHGQRLCVRSAGYVEASRGVEPRKPWGSLFSCESYQGNPSFNLWVVWEVIGNTAVSCVGGAFLGRCPFGESISF